MLLLTIVLLGVAYVGARFALARAGAVNTMTNVTLGVTIFVAFVLGITAKTLLEPLVVAPVPAAPLAAQAPVLAPRDVSALCAHVEKDVSAQGNGFADEFNDVSGTKLSGVVNRNVEIAVSGWAVDRDSKSDATAACLFVDGQPQPQAASSVGMARPDIVAALKNSGYVIRVSARRLGVGHHVVTVAERYTDGEFARLNGSFDITVR